MFMRVLRTVRAWLTSRHEAMPSLHYPLNLNEDVLTEVVCAAIEDPANLSKIRRFGLENDQAYRAQANTVDDFVFAEVDAPPDSFRIAFSFGAFLDFLDIDDEALFLDDEDKYPAGDWFTVEGVIECPNVLPEAWRGVDWTELNSQQIRDFLRVVEIEADRA